MYVLLPGRYQYDITNASCCVIKGVPGPVVDGTEPPGTPGDVRDA